MPLYLDLGCSESSLKLFVVIHLSGHVLVFKHLGHRQVWGDGPNHRPDVLVPTTPPYI